MNSDRPSRAYSSIRSATSTWLPTSAVPAPPRSRPTPAPLGDLGEHRRRQPRVLAPRAGRSERGLEAELFGAAGDLAEVGQGRRADGARRAGRDAVAAADDVAAVAVGRQKPVEAQGHPSSLRASGLYTIIPIDLVYMDRPGRGSRGPVLLAEGCSSPGQASRIVRNMRPSEIRRLIQLKPVELDAARRRLSACHDVFDLRVAARRLIPRPVFDYVDGGADEELSMAANMRAFRRWRFQPRALTEITAVDTATRVLDYDLPLPLLLAPTGYTRMMHPAGEIGAARSAQRHGLPYTLSTMATTSIEAVAEALSSRPTGPDRPPGPSRPTGPDRPPGRPA